MDREGFRNRLKQYKKAREENPGLKYWELKDIPKYDEGINGVTLKEKEDAFWRGDTQKMAELVEREGKQLTYVTPQSNMDEVVITANKPKQNQYSELDFAKDVAGFVPILGEAVDIYDMGKSLYNGNYSQAALLGAGLLLPNWLEKGGKFLYKSIKNKRLANQFSKMLDNVELNKTDLPVSTKTIQFEPVVRPSEPYVDYQMADMRNFLKTRFNKWTKHYGYDPVPLDLSIQESLEQMKDRIIAHNTFVRGVRDPKQEMDFYIKNDPFNERAELMRQAYLNTVQSLNELNLPNTAENRMKVAASQLVGQTGHGRAGMGYNSTKGSLYTSNSLNTAGGYASYGKTAAGKVFKVQRPVDFSGDYHNWLLKGDFPLFNNSTLKRFADDSYFFQDLPYLLKTGRSLKTDALQKANVSDFNYETWLNDKLNQIKTNTQNQFPKEYNDILRQVDDQFENVYPGLNRFYKRSINPDDIIETAARKAALDVLDYSLPSKLLSNPGYLKTRFNSSKNMYFRTYLNTKKKLIRDTSPQFAKKQHYGKMMHSQEYKNAIRELLEENGINYTTYDPNGVYDGIFTTERKHHPKKDGNAYQHFIFVGNPGNYPVNIIDEISPDIWQTYNSGTRAHVGESFKGLSRKSYAEGGEVTGPPTEEQWYADINKYNPTILDNASLEWSMNALKKELHSQAMGLPGYAPMWNEYMQSLPKAAPDVDEFVDDVWANENPNNVGYKKGKYYPHKSPEGGKMTIGPGLKLGSGSHRISEREAKRGVTKPRLNQEMRRVAKGYFKDVDAAINNGQTTNPADTVSPQIKAGLADILHQTGSLKKWPKLINSVREGDLEKIKEESIVTWRDNNGVLHEDTRRNNLRNKKYWHY